MNLQNSENIQFSMYFLMTSQWKSHALIAWIIVNIKTILNSLPFNNVYIGNNNDKKFNGIWTWLVRVQIFREAVWASHDFLSRDQPSSYLNEFSEIAPYFLKLFTCIHFYWHFRFSEIFRYRKRKQLRSTCSIVPLFSNSMSAWRRFGWAIQIKEKNKVDLFLLDFIWYGRHCIIFC